MAKTKNTGEKPEKKKPGRKETPTKLNMTFEEAIALSIRTQMPKKKKK